MLEDRRLSGAPEQAVDEAQTNRHDTRAAIDIPPHTVSILVPALAQAAEEATQATFAMRDAADPDALTALRQAAKDAHGWLVHHHRRQSRSTGRAVP
jgi:hypothetical protein